MAAKPKQDIDAYQTLSEKSKFVQWVNSVLTFCSKHSKILIFFAVFLCLLIIVTIISGLHANRIVCIVTNSGNNILKIDCLCKIYFWLKMMWSFLFSHLATLIGGMGGGAFLVAKFIDKD
jgi:hypothetical protein